MCHFDIITGSFNVHMKNRDLRKIHINSESFKLLNVTKVDFTLLHTVMTDEYRNVIKF